MFNYFEVVRKGFFSRHRLCLVKTPSAAVIVAFPVLIGLSCLFAKQHFVIDVPVGPALGWAIYELCLIMI